MFRLVSSAVAVGWGIRKIETVVQPSMESEDVFEVYSWDCDHVTPPLRIGTMATEYPLGDGCTLRLSVVDGLNGPKPSLSIANSECRIWLRLKDYNTLRSLQMEILELLVQDLPERHFPLTNDIHVRLVGNNSIRLELRSAPDIFVTLSKNALDVLCLLHHAVFANWTELENIADFAEEQLERFTQLLFQRIPQCFDEFEVITEIDLASFFVNEHQKVLQTMFSEVDSLQFLTEMCVFRPEAMIKRLISAVQYAVVSEM